MSQKGKELRKPTKRLVLCDASLQRYFNVVFFSEFIKGRTETPVGEFWGCLKIEFPICKPVFTRLRALT